MHIRPMRWNRVRLGMTVARSSASKASKAKAACLREGQQIAG